MDSTYLDVLVRSWERVPRRDSLKLLAAGALGGVLARLGAHEAEARRKKKKKKKKKNGSGGTTTPKSLRQICTPGQDTCNAGLQCGTPTTRHSCSSTVQGVSAWCCVPPGGGCTECDCCGNYYCEYDDNNNPTCQPNPEG